MTDAQPLSKNDPRMIAWVKYKHTLAMENPKRWAAVSEDMRTNLWAAFIAGWMAATQPEE